jgi:hypothetical protein
MTRTKTTHRLLLLLGAVLAAGCADATAPARTTTGVFVLRSFDGQPLPALTQDYPTLRFFIVADTIVFFDTGEFTESSVMRVESTQPPSVNFQGGGSEGTFAFRGDSIDFRLRCPPGALCIMPPLAWRSTDGFTTAYRSTTGLIEVKHYEQVGFPPD